MTKKDYEKLAAILKPYVILATSSQHPLVVQIAEAVAECCEVDNKRFKRDKFLEACGLTI